MIQPDINGSVLRNCNPEGCHQFLSEQWQRLNLHKKGRCYKSVLIIGCSSGFGLASRLTTLYNGAETSVGVCFEREPNENHPGSAGWHLNQAYQSIADEHEQTHVTLNQDAFLKNTKQAVIDKIKALGQTFDLVIYSVAAGIKIDDEGQKIRSSILPIHRELKGYQVDINQERFDELTLPTATKQQIDDTVTVMGGQDWKDWMKTLRAAGVLSDHCQTYNYSYIGGDLNATIYHLGTLGAAKKDMHLTARLLREDDFNAQVVVCKALVTKASLFIPLMAPYVMALKAVLSHRDQDENVFDQMRRLFSGGAIEEGSLLRLDNYELDPAVQEAVKIRLNKMTPDNFRDVIDFDGVRDEWLAMHGFVNA